MEKREHNNWLPTVLALIVLLGLVITANYTIRQPVLNLNLSASFQDVSDAVIAEDWQQAREDLSSLTNRWNKARPRVFLNAGVDSLRDFETSLARLEKMIHLQDQVGALAELASLRVIWAEFLSL